PSVDVHAAAVARDHVGADEVVGAGDEDPGPTIAEGRGAGHIRADVVALDGVVRPADADAVLDVPGDDVARLGCGPTDQVVRAADFGAVGNVALDAVVAAAGAEGGKDVAFCRIQTADQVVVAALDDQVAFVVAADRIALNGVPARPEELRAR